MSNLSRVVVFLLLAGFLAAGYWLYTRTEVAPAPVRPPEPVPAVVDDQPRPPVEAAPESTTPTAPVQKEERVEAVPDNTRADLPQGIKGRVLLPSGAPAAGVPLFLIESLMNDPIRIFLMSKSGQTLPPVSWGETAADGTFALGVGTPDKDYDLRIASDSNPEVNHKSVKVREDEWVDTGDLTLEHGVVVRGRVVDEFSKAGVPNVTVYLEQSNQAHTALPTPGRERGIVAITDGTGAFAIASAPSEGLINLTAEAEGYAVASLKNQQVQAEGPGYTLEISRGQPIAGIVVDADGEPLRNVQVTAQSLSQKTPQTAVTTTGGDGVFAFPSLREGPYQLTTSSNTHAEAKSPPVMTGDTAVKLVLAQRPWVKLRVFGARGEEIKAYRISLKRHFPNNPLGIGNVPEFNDRSITPADYPSTFGGEWAVVRGLPSGDFQLRFQIQDRNHAKSLSEPFTVREGAEPTEVIARLTLGAAITGTVIDDRGRPVRDAIVSSAMNNDFSGQGGIFDLFRSMIPEKHTNLQRHTDAQGRFRLDKLAFAEYMVRVSHADFCEGTAFDVTLAQEGQVVDVGVIQLQRGTIVEGYTTITGQAAGQVKVVLSVPQEAQAGVEGAAPAAPVRMPLSLSTISDNDGRYAFLKRVPPGRYKVVASRQTGEQNPFMILLDMKDSERTVTITAGQDRMRLDFDLPAR